MALRIPCQGVLSTFLRRALLGQDLEVYEGEQLRDPVYVDDVVEAFLRVGAVTSLPARTYNVAGPEALSLRRIAEIIAEAAGVRVLTQPFPAERKRIDIGSYVGDSQRIRRDFGWVPRVCFADAIRASLVWYREHLTHYLEADRPASCAMPEHQGRKRKLVLVPAQ
jgi:UDP-glucose 4-epimerase